jgi:hypothetical protein
MGTTQNGGTSPSQLLSGLKNYLDESHVPFKRIASQGWRSVPEFVVANKRQTVDLEWIKSGTLGKSSTWILIGWCKYDHKKDNCDIFDGHWMTVVGYGKNREGKNDPKVLIVHDPAERSERKNYYPRMITLTHGVIDGDRPAKGILTLTGDVVIKPSADYGIIQGAYRLEL